MLVLFPRLQFYDFAVYVERGLQFTACNFHEKFRVYVVPGMNYLWCYTIVWKKMFQLFLPAHLIKLQFSGRFSFCSFRLKINLKLISPPAMNGSLKFRSYQSTFQFAFVNIGLRISHEPCGPQLLLWWKRTFNKLITLSDWQSVDAKLFLHFHDCLLSYYITSGITVCIESHKTFSPELKSQLIMRDIFKSWNISQNQISCPFPLAFLFNMAGESFLTIRGEKFLSSLRNAFVLVFTQQTYFRRERNMWSETCFLSRKINTKRPALCIMKQARRVFIENICST